MPSNARHVAARPSSFSQALSDCLEVLKDALSSPWCSVVEQQDQILGMGNQTTEDALRVLFRLSEHETTKQNRVVMARYDDIVPVLLEFIQLCASQHREDELSLALLVLKNISEPTENKRLISFIHRGARIIGDLLSKDPSCYLMALVLVSFTTTDDDLCNELATREEDFHLVESITYSLRVASLSEAEYLARQSENTYHDTTKSTAERLMMLLAEDEFCKNTSRFPSPMPPVRAFPETERWCLSALRNLTRPSALAPSRSFNAAHAIAHSGIVKHLLRYITVAAATTNDYSIGGDSSLVGTASTSSLSAERTPLSIEASWTEDTLEAYSNDPRKWDATSPQDAALFILMNLSLCQRVTGHMRQYGAVPVLLRVANYQAENDQVLSVDEAQTMRFQKLKARICLAWILAAEGMYGRQPPKSWIPDRKLSREHRNRALQLSDDLEVRTLVELFSNVLHHRVVNGAPSSSAATLSLKCLLYAIRCLLSNFENREKVATLAGPKLNILLMKVIALRATDHVPLEDLDKESASNALDSLYLLSSFGFKHVFLPPWFFANDDSSSLMAKILLAFEKSNPVMSASTKHAKSQLLQRIKYLCSDKLQVASPKFFNLQLPASDLKFTPALLADLRKVQAKIEMPGASPLVDVHDRPVVRTRTVPTIDAKWCRQSDLFDDPSEVVRYPSALVAAQAMSMADKHKYRGIGHDETKIDEVLIANVIVASTKKKKDCFGYSWQWWDSSKFKQQSRSEKKPFSDLFSETKCMEPIKPAKKRLANIFSEMFTTKDPAFDVSCNEF